MNPSIPEQGRSGAGLFVRPVQFSAPSAPARLLVGRVSAVSLCPFPDLASQFRSATRIHSPSSSSRTVRPHQQKTPGAERRPGVISPVTDGSGELHRPDNRHAILQRLCPPIRTVWTREHIPLVCPRTLVGGGDLRPRGACYAEDAGCVVRYSFLVVRRFWPRVAVGSALVRQPRATHVAKREGHRRARGCGRSVHAASGLGDGAAAWWRCFLRDSPKVLQGLDHWHAQR